MIPKIGSTVIYGTNGVCRVEDLREEDFGSSRGMFYVLRSLSEKKGTVIYLPADNEALLDSLKPLMSAEELARLAHATDPADGEVWPRDARLRNKLCKEMLATGDRTQLILLIKSLVRDGRRDSAQGKKISAATEALLTRAQAMLYEEFSLAYDMKEEELIPFLFGECDCPAK